MGAALFGVIERGETTREAFARATERARYEHGHGGYSGTIAEKRDYRVFDAAAEAPALIAKLEAKRARLTLAEQRRLAKRFAALRAMVRAKGWSALSEAERDELDTLSPVTDPERLAQMRARLSAQVKALRSKRSRAQAVGNALLDFHDPRIADKWGPAGCVEVKKGEWYFFGWASS